MKNVALILIFLVVSIGSLQAQEAHKAKIIVASYSGSSTEGYYFTNDLNDKPIQFAKVEPKVLEKYDLNSTTYLRKEFRVAYINEEGAAEESGAKTIIDLELIGNTKE